MFLSDLLHKRLSTVCHSSSPFTCKCRCAVYALLRCSEIVQDICGNFCAIEFSFCYCPRESVFLCLEKLVWLLAYHALWVSGDRRRWERLHEHLKKAFSLSLHFGLKHVLVFQDINLAFVRRYLRFPERWSSGIYLPLQTSGIEVADPPIILVVQDQLILLFFSPCVAYFDFMLTSVSESRLTSPKMK